MKFLIILLLCSCIPTSTTAGVRRMAEASLRNCLKNSNPTISGRAACREESYQFCLEHMPKNHIEKGCGLGWTDGDFR